MAKIAKKRKRAEATKARTAARYQETEIGRLTRMVTVRQEKLAEAEAKLEAVKAKL